MPNHEEHCQDSLKRYGKTFSELHRWMDEPSEIMASKHRLYRHDPFTTPKVALSLFGENADQACLDHIRLDHKESRQKGIGKMGISVRETSKGKLQDPLRYGFGTLMSFILGVLIISQSDSMWAGIILLLISFLVFLVFLGSLLEKNEERM